MYVAHIILLLWLCGLTVGSTFNKNNQHASNLTIYSIPFFTSIANFQDNKIRHVPANFFWNLPFLHSIKLFENLISTIDNNAFGKVPTVRTIFLQQNKLSVIKRHMFAGLPVLADLRLFSNMIYLIEPQSFKDNPALINLMLEDNALQKLPGSMFGLQNHPTSLNMFYAYSNPISCDENLVWLKNAEQAGGWITLNSPHRMICHSPPFMEGCKWNELTAQDLTDTSGQCCNPIRTL